MAQRARTTSRFAALWPGFCCFRSPASGSGTAASASPSRAARPGGRARSARQGCRCRAGAWLANYGRWPVTLWFPAVGLVAPLWWRPWRARIAAAWSSLSSGLGIAGVIGTMGVSLFPFLLPSSSASRQQSDRLGCLEQPAHARHHADRRHHLSADRSSPIRPGSIASCAVRSRAPTSRPIARRATEEPQCGISAGYWVLDSPALSPS